ncbi:hypothetical protein BsWGS_03897 [Bradybaena similaris]
MKIAGPVHACKSSSCRQASPSISTPLITPPPPYTSGSSPGPVRLLRLEFPGEGERGRETRKCFFHPSAGQKQTLVRSQEFDQFIDTVIETKNFDHLGPQLSGP